MKNICILLLCLFSVVSLKAQKFEHLERGKYMVIKSESLNSLLKPYQSLGPITPSVVKELSVYKRWNALFIERVFTEEIQNKIKNVTGYLACNIFFDKQGKVIDVTFQMSNAIYEKLDEADIRKLYNQIKKETVNMSSIEWKGDFIYSNMVIWLNRKKTN